MKAATPETLSTEYVANPKHQQLRDVRVGTIYATPIVGKEKRQRLFDWSRCRSSFDSLKTNAARNATTPAPRECCRAENTPLQHKNNERTAFTQRQI